MGLVAIFYYVRVETSLFVASCDSQCYGGGIRPLLHYEVHNEYLIRNGPHMKHSFHQFFYCCMCIFCPGKVFSLTIA
jgi:hypothetical protein